MSNNHDCIKTFGVFVTFLSMHVGEVLHILNYFSDSLFAYFILFSGEANVDGFFLGLANHYFVGILFGIL